MRYDARPNASLFEAAFCPGSLEVAIPYNDCRQELRYDKATPYSTACLPPRVRLMTSGQLICLSLLTAHAGAIQQEHICTLALQSVLPM